MDNDEEWRKFLLGGFVCSALEGPAIIGFTDIGTVTERLGSQ